MNMAYVWIALTTLFTVYGQLILKWRASSLVRAQPDADRLHYVLGMLLDPWVISGLIAAFGASICWMLAVSRIELSKAYPFMSLNFVLVALIAWPLFGEAFGLHKSLGLTLIILGLLISGQG